MATSARRCAGCGGPLPETAPDQRQITCPFCGIVNDLAHPPAGVQPVSIKIDVGQAAAAGRKVALVVVVVVGLVGISIAIGVWTMMRPVSEAIKTVSHQATQQPRQQARQADARQRPMTPADLATTTEAGWRELQVPVPATDWAAFEPVANLDWAMAIARGWMVDARLTRIDVTRLTPAGTIDLTAGADDTAGYRFVSPAKIAEWDRIADRETNARVPYELMIKIAQRKVTALVSRGRPSSRELPPAKIDSTRLGEVIAAAKRRGFGDYPFYNGYLIHLEREGWVWYLQSLSGRESLPRIRARDGAPYPYPR